MTVFRLARGAADSPVILHIPHASREISADARWQILLDDAALSTELDHMTDSHTDLIADRAAAGASILPWTFANQWSRLVVDPERFPDEREEMRTVGMGAVYTRTSGGQALRGDSPEAIAELLRTHYEPYARGMTDAVNERLAATGQAVIIDVHSYPSRALPYELHADGARPQVCLGADDFHTPAWLLDAAERAFSRIGDVAANTPFSGCYVPLEHHRSNPNVRALMIEIRRDIYMSEPGGPPTDGVEAVAKALTGLIDHVSVHASD